MESAGVNATAWINGSFATRKLDPDDLSTELEPGDIDVVTWIDYDAANALPFETQLMLQAYWNGGESTKAKFGTHTIGIASCLPGHPYFTVFEGYRRWYRDIFSRHSPPSIRPAGGPPRLYSSSDPRKGFISITIGDPSIAPQIDERRL
jgi:hypothetical protein